MSYGNQIDSNVTGLRYAEETTLGVLPGSPVWNPLEPNTYADFGGEITTVARRPINAGRQNQRGVVTDLDASGGFNQDMTGINQIDIMQGFMFANTRTKVYELITSIDEATDEFDVAANGDNFAAGDLLFASNLPLNGGLHLVTGTPTATAVEVTTDLVAETQGATSRIIKVGAQGTAGDIDVDTTGTNPALTSTTFDFTTLGVIAGEWMYIGGDAALTRFTTAGNNGFARVLTVAANRLEFDKTQGTMATEASVSETIQLFVGRALRNEPLTADIICRSYQLERTLGDDGSGTQSEYLIGAVPNTLQWNVNTADKITMDMGFVAIDHETRDGTEGVKSGTRPALSAGTAYNTSSDISLLDMSIKGQTTPLFAFVQEMTASIDNGVSPSKAVGTLGAFSATTGNFSVSGSVTAYFQDVAAVSAIRNNEEVQFVWASVKDNVGVLVDIPSVTLGDGRLNVELDQPITLPLSLDAAESTDFNHTMMTVHYDYLPTVAG